MITLSNINFGYHKRKPLFKGLNLQLEGGHIYGLLGKNGAGKTTLLKILAGLRFASSGTVTILRESAALRKQEVLEQISFLPEEMFIPHLKISCFINTYASFYPNFNKDQFYEYLSEFEIEDRNASIQKLSYGQKKKVLIAFALAQNTKILIMDEPTNGLDIPSKNIFRKLMAQIADEERIILVSTHQVRDLHSLIDAVVILDNGEIVLHKSNDEITQKLLFTIEEESNEQTIYAEDTLRGRFAVKENPSKEESLMDIELFFNAVIMNKERIKQIFNH
ncbi:MAG: ABC transporter ATP-binding protein [Bacteroidales bacterium]|jgi:ABC-2 type transport system ATP-binding protein|nr:ABC transporter ATP-binding protein [Bacteroidales bacterium]